MLERQLLKVDKSGTSKKEKLGLKYIVHTYTSTSPWQRIPGSYVLDGPVVGRDEDTAKIVELLSRDVDPSSPTKYQVVAIVDMGGLGKTTLVAQVFNDVAAIEQFDIKIWVSVSDDFNLESVTRTISKKVKSQPCDTDDFSQLQDNLSKDIDGKRFLIVLDDVWSTCDYDSWTKLQAPFRGGAHGSKHVSNDRPPNFDLLKRKIVMNCNGLPLAAKTLGGVLRCKETDKWEEILNSKSWSTSDESNILPVLRKGYLSNQKEVKRWKISIGRQAARWMFSKDSISDLHFWCSPSKATNSPRCQIP
ncbi:hypothetical protein ACLB2K_068411 [Fragaria x ananassa]